MKKQKDFPKGRVDCMAEGLYHPAKRASPGLKNKRLLLAKEGNASTKEGSFPGSQKSCATVRGGKCVTGQLFTGKRKMAEKEER